MLKSAYECGAELALRDFVKEALPSWAGHLVNAGVGGAVGAMAAGENNRGKGFLGGAALGAGAGAVGGALAGHVAPEIMAAQKKLHAAQQALRKVPNHLGDVGGDLHAIARTNVNIAQENLLASMRNSNGNFSGKAIGVMAGGVAAPVVGGVIAGDMVSDPDRYRPW